MSSGSGRVSSAQVRLALVSTGAQKRLQEPPLVLNPSKAQLGKASSRGSLVSRDVSVSFSVGGHHLDHLHEQLLDGKVALANSVSKGVCGLSESPRIIVVLWVEDSSLIAAVLVSWSAVKTLP